jgi:hypothetical protein
MLATVKPRIAQLEDQDDDRPEDHDQTTPDQRPPRSSSRAQRGGRPGPAKPTYLVKVLGGGDLLPVAGTKFQKTAAIAQAQYGRVARAQLLAAGVTDGMVTTMLRGGALIRVHHGVYAVGHLAPIPFAREAAALLACRDGAVLSHLTAGALWYLISPRPDDEAIETTILRGEKVQRDGIVCHRTLHLDGRDVRVLRRLPITSPARTLLDMGEHLTPDELERALDVGLARGVLRVSRIREVIARMPNRRGAGLLRRLTG